MQRIGLVAVVSEAGVVLRKAALRHTFPRRKKQWPSQHIYSGYRFLFVAGRSPGGEPASARIWRFERAKNLLPPGVTTDNGNEFAQHERMQSRVNITRKWQSSVRRNLFLSPSRDFSRICNDAVGIRFAFSTSLEVSQSH